MWAMNISRASIEWLIDRMQSKDMKKPYVIRTSRSTAVKIAETLGVTWPHKEKGKHEVGPFLIIA